MAQGQDSTPENTAQSAGNEEVLAAIAALNEKVDHLCNDTSIKAALEMLAEKVGKIGSKENLRENRINQGIAAYKRRGTAIDFVKSLVDLSKKQKRSFYNEVMTRVKGIAPKTNPFA